jgi:hypothetical protein
MPRTLTTPPLPSPGSRFSSASRGHLLGPDDVGSQQGRAGRVFNCGYLQTHVLESARKRTLRVAAAVGAHD